DSRILNLVKLVLRNIVLRRHEVLVVFEPRGVVKQGSDRDALAIIRKIGEDVGEAVFIAQLAVVDQQHDGGRGKLLGQRSEAEVGVGLYGSVSTKICNAVATLNLDFAVFYYEHRHAG